MDAEFWHQRWESNVINFHQKEVNSLLIAYFDELSLNPGDRIFVPLCGKTLDISWLLASGYRVVGAELSEIAVRQLFADLGYEPNITVIDGLKCFSVPDIEVYVGDIFKLTPAMLGPVEGVYDRAAFVALTEEMRHHYSRHVSDITKTAPYVLITFAYDQALMEGPPFSINKEEIQNLYGDRYKIDPRASLPLKGGLKGLKDVREEIWILKASAFS